jgi:hypothetical protein
MHSRNPNITMEFIEKYFDKPRNWNAISQNKFKKNKIVTRKIIQRWYKKLYQANNSKLIMLSFDTLYETKQTNYITIYLKYNIVKYI